MVWQCKENLILSKANDDIFIASHWSLNPPTLILQQWIGATPTKGKNIAEKAPNRDCSHLWLIYMDGLFLHLAVYMKIILLSQWFISLELYNMTPSDSLYQISDGMLDRMSVRMLDWMSDQMLDWRFILDRMSGWMSDQMSDWMSDWMLDWMLEQMLDRMLDQMLDRMSDDMSIDY